MKREKVAKIEQNNHRDEIEKLLESFIDSYLNEDYLRYCLNLCDLIERQQILSLDRGKKEIWAAAILFTIARLNFLFDKENDNFITPDMICDFFRTKKSTCGNKASEIADVCDLEYGQEGLSDPHIIDSFSFVQLENGLIVSKGMLERGKFIVKIATEKESEEIHRFEEERRRLEEEKAREKKERRVAINRIIAEERKKKEQFQLNLFDDR